VVRDHYRYMTASLILGKTFGHCKPVTPKERFAADFATQLAGSGWQRVGWSGMTKPEKSN
jgi:hypothetical protein